MQLTSFRPSCVHCADFGWVRQALDGLGAELRRRIEAAGAGLLLSQKACCLWPCWVCQPLSCRALAALHPCLLPCTPCSLPMRPQFFSVRMLALRHSSSHAGAQTLLDKLRLLNHLLFGPGPPPRHRQFAAIPPPDGFGLEIKVSSKSFSRA